VIRSVAAALSGALAVALAIPSGAETGATDRAETGTVALEIISGVVADAEGPVPGAMVTLSRGSPAHTLTVFSDDDGRFVLPAAPVDDGSALRVRRIGWRDLRIDNLSDQLAGLRERSLLESSGLEPALSLRLVRETVPAALAEQLPANLWYRLVLDRVDDPGQLEELKRQCTYCHQQGNWATRRPRSDEEWRKVIALMGRMGGMLTSDLRQKLPDLFNQAYDPTTAVPALTSGMQDRDFVPPPPAAVRRALIDEWDLGGRASMQHDIMVHPDGRVYSVDMSQDMLYRLDPGVPGGAREQWPIPPGDLPLGGVFAAVGGPDMPSSNARVGPHSLQAAPDGVVWITLAIGNQLARFDPATEEWSIHALERGFYPHTLRLDQRGRVWYTIAASNHIGMLDPASGEHREIRLPARTWGQAIALRAMPFVLWLGKYVDLGSAAAESDGMNMPVPYGIDVAPDGGIWFSQLNEHRIGRVDPDSFDVEMIDTPFPAPRRMRFDAHGRLWIPSFSGNVIARFDPEQRTFESFALPEELGGGEVPYALNVDHRTGLIWICGTNSDSLLRFDPEHGDFRVYPLPTRVTYTREIDFDAEGRVWTSNSNAPAWQIEGGMPRLLRLDPRDPSTGGEVALQTRR